MCKKNLTIKKVETNTAIVPPCEDARGADAGKETFAGLAGGRASRADHGSKSPT